VHKRPGRLPADYGILGDDGLGTIVQEPAKAERADVSIDGTARPNVQARPRARVKRNPPQFNDVPYENRMNLGSRRGPLAGRAEG